MPADIENILFITLSCVGDAVMTTSVLQALHQLYPDSKVDIVADPRSEIIFKYCPYRAKVVNKHKEKLFRGGPALIKELSGKRYDIIVDLRTDGLAYLLNGKKRYTKWSGKSYGPHEIESLMGIIREIFVDRHIPDPHIWLNEESHAFAKDLIDDSAAEKILAIAPGCGGKKAEKFWPPANYAFLANGLNDFFDHVLLVGGQGDQRLALEIIDDLQLPCIDMCGKTDLLQAAALLQQAQIFVGSDSGLGHVAAAVGTSTLSLFSVDKPERCLPWGKSASWLMGRESDARNITVAEVATKIRAMISN